MSDEEVGVEEVEESGSSELMSVSDVAKEVIAGRYGIGQKRRERLAEAGYDVRAVEKEVVRQTNQPGET